jgi:hypothetical protein
MAAGFAGSSIAVHAGRLLVPRCTRRVHARPGPDHGSGSDAVVFHYADLLSRVSQTVARNLGGDASESAVRAGARLSSRLFRGPPARVAATGEIVGYRAGAVLSWARVVLSPAEKFRRRDLAFAVLESPTHSIVYE